MLISACDLERGRPTFRKCPAPLFAGSVGADDRTGLTLASLNGTSLGSVPNCLTIAGYASTLYWIAGGSPWFAAAGLLADELDGDAARNLDQTSEFGSNLDWAVDVALAAIIAVKLGGPWLLALPFITFGQALLRSEEIAPPIGSARALMTVVALARGGF